MSDNVVIFPLTCPNTSLTPAERWHSNVQHYDNCDMDNPNYDPQKPTKGTSSNVPSSVQPTGQQFVVGVPPSAQLQVLQQPFVPQNLPQWQHGMQVPMHASNPILVGASQASSAVAPNAVYTPGFVGIAAISEANKRLHAKFQQQSAPTVGSAPWSMRPQGQATSAGMLIPPVSRGKGKNRAEGPALKTIDLHWILRSIVWEDMTALIENTPAEVNVEELGTALLCKIAPLLT